MGRFLPKAYSAGELARIAWDRGDRFFVPRISLGWGDAKIGVTFDNQDEGNRQMTEIVDVGWALHTWAVEGNVGLPLFVRP